MTVGPVGGSAGRTSPYDAGPSTPTDWKGVGAVGGAIVGEVIGGLLERGELRRQARWAKIQAEQDVGLYYAAANRAGAANAAQIYSGGLTGGAGLETLIAAERGAAEEDAYLRRFNARVVASALRSQGNFAAIAGLGRGLSKAATFAAGGGVGG